MEPRYYLRSQQGNGPVQEASELQMTRRGRQKKQPAAKAAQSLAPTSPGVLADGCGRKKLKLAEGAQQLLPLVVDQYQKLGSAASGTESHAAATADLLASLRKELTGASTPALSPSSFPLLHLPNEIVTKICRMDLDAAPGLRLTCQALHTAVRATRLRLVQSPDLHTAAYQKATHCPARLAPVIELDLTDAGGYVNRSLVRAATRHSPALESITLADVDDLEALACMPKLSKLIVDRPCMAVGRSILSPLTNLKTLRALSITGQVYLDEAEGDLEAFSLLQPILALSELTCLELGVSWAPRMDKAMPTAASLPVISAALVKLARLALPPAISWNEASLAHLATLTGLTALSIGHDDSADGMAPYSSLFQCLAALPRLADISLHLPRRSSVPALPTLFQRTNGAPSPLRSLRLNIAGAGAPFSAITQHLGAAPFLTHLAVSVSSAVIIGCSDALVRIATSPPALRSLCFKWVKLPDEAIAQLSCLSPLTALTLLYAVCSVSRASSAFAHLRSLQSLTTNLVQQQGLAAIGLLTSLASLVLHSMQGGVEGLQHLSQLKRLRYLIFKRTADGPDVEDHRFYAALVHLTALKQCRHPSWGIIKACSLDEIQRRYISKRPAG